MTPLGLETATLWLAAHCLNHLRYPVSHSSGYGPKPNSMLHNLESCNASIKKNNNNNNNNNKNKVNSFPCHHGMTHLQDADTRDCIQLWKEAESIIILIILLLIIIKEKQLRTTDKRWSSRLRAPVLCVFKCLCYVSFRRCYSFPWCTFPSTQPKLQGNVHQRKQMITVGEKTSERRLMNA
jgi:hypothetical protein